MFALNIVEAFLAITPRLPLLHPRVPFGEFVSVSPRHPSSPFCLLQYWLYRRRIHRVVILFHAAGIDPNVTRFNKKNIV
jgi:hypothetical protein